MIHVICIHCRRESHDDCINEEKGTKSWCDCHHKGGVIMQPKDCKHLRMDHADPLKCPTCGKELDEDNSSGNPSTEPDEPETGIGARAEAIVNHQKTKREEIKDRVRKFNTASKRDKETPTS